MVVSLNKIMWGIYYVYGRPCRRVFSLKLQFSLIVCRKGQPIKRCFLVEKGQAINVTTFEHDYVYNQFFSLNLISNTAVCKYRHFNTGAHG